MLAARLDQGESLRKNFASDENARIVAGVLRFSKLTPQQLGAKLGHADQTQVSRWLNSQENAAAVLKIWAIEDLREFLCMALIEETKSPRVRVRWVAEIAQAVNA